MTPFAILLAIAAALLLLALVSAAGGRGFARALRLLLALALLVLAAGVGLLALGVRDYFGLDERPVARLEVRQRAPQTFGVTLTDADGLRREYDLRGDEWQLDARVVRWQFGARLAGVPPLYRLERLSGRYRDIDQEREAPRSVHALGSDGLLDLATLARQYPRWLPFVDARWGSAAYLPLIDGARYEVRLNARGGLVAVPADAATRDLLEQSGW
ncbi:hypothetical protein [Coralloluteibacterium stylophorae]|uniref:Cation/multidrug efflux pump n=1 Tax=Coralloluteibacterium stylophorae TaxID=1776034 RepID=A0A8J7VTS7_9GAMM|nr:hypothetical protein [Coralloluteibacterium stylophorae]MBS7458813.1 hypothetical protein [Coralloluteibacterium stylophorae]